MTDAEPGDVVGLEIMQRIWRGYTPEHVEWVPASADYFAARPHLIARDELPAFLAGSDLPRPWIHDVDESASIVSFFEDGPRLDLRRWGRSFYTSEHGGGFGVRMGAPDQRVEVAIAPRHLLRFQDHYAHQESAAFIDARLGAEWRASGRSVAEGLDELGVDAVMTGQGSGNAWVLPRDREIVRVVHDGKRPQVVPTDRGSWAWRHRQDFLGIAMLGGVTAGVVGAVAGIGALTDGDG